MLKITFTSCPSAYYKSPTFKLTVRRSPLEFANDDEHVVELAALLLDHLSVHAEAGDLRLVVDIA